MPSRINGLSVTMKFSFKKASAMKPQAPPNPATRPARRARNAAAAKSIHSDSGAAQHVVGNAASASPGTGTDTTESADWMAERLVSPGAAPAAGTPVDTGSPRGLRRGKAVESKRGQQ
ncbi:MAG: hypothetical protein M3Y32_10365 [Pseudomonadota bacterium]|nr:hypothetical protein [Pseudomonadota bacterium]